MRSLDFLRSDEQECLSPPLKGAALLVSALIVRAVGGVRLRDGLELSVFLDRKLPPAGV